MLSIARSRLALVSQFFFLVVNALALLSGLVYNYKTPELYANNAHSKIGWTVTWIASAWVVIALLQGYTARTKAHSLGACTGDELNVANMARYQRVQKWQAPSPSRWSKDSGQGTERNSASLHEQSRSPSIESSEEQFIGQGQRDSLEADGLSDYNAEKRGFLGGIAVDRLLSGRFARFAAGKSMKVLRLIYVLVDRTILVQGFVAIASGTIVYGGIGVSCCSTLLLRISC